ncbi:MAG: hypothetical protein RSG92_04065 [Pseudomonas sp.]
MHHVGTSAQAWLIQLQARFAITADQIDTALRILTIGTSADQQLTTYERTLARGFTHERALRDIVGELLQHTSLSVR